MMKTTPRLRRLLAALAVASIALTGACGDDDDPAITEGDETTTTAAADPAGQATSQITIKDFMFQPKAAAVKVGEVVTWTNADTENHGIKDVGGAFVGPDFGTKTGNPRFTHTYDKPGSYPYICNIHNSMAGTITVS